MYVNVNMHLLSVLFSKQYIYINIGKWK